MHKQVQTRGEPILIGAGTLNQRKYEGEAVVYDVVEPFRELYLGVPRQKRFGRFTTRSRTSPQTRAIAVSSPSPCWSTWRTFRGMSRWQH